MEEFRALVFFTRPENRVLGSDVGDYFRGTW